MTPREFALDGKVALVTGGGRGLGLEIARALASAGASVLINGRDQDRVEHAVATVTSLGGLASPLPFDVTNEAAVEKAFKDIRAKHGRLDILINNVGVRDRRGFFAFELEYPSGEPG